MWILILRGWTYSEDGEGEWLGSDDDLNGQKSLSPLSSKTKLDRPVTSHEMYDHYVLGKGESLSLDNLGAKKLVSGAILKEKAFGKPNGSVQSRFTRDIAREFQQGTNNYTFNRCRV